ncbi:hypothetical protein [Streptomyces sp. NBC_01257]|uniref:hypothetical protein n=1 Tax=Streptomyces sp. NBC_01257 TaxID=2903799 RepID=UPI002DDC2DEB|nr:hypothetical protein [Streptomyces sp. NBC_01257]WRZ66595.1 hypothetical protein OG408_23215 [Streptomyces sp. NBC_01257]
MDVTDRSGHRPDPDAEAVLIRAAMEQAAEGAPPLPDLVPVALVQGRRRRTRARAAVGAGVTGAVALGVFGAVLATWVPEGRTQPAQTWSSAASQTTTAAPSPVPSARPVPAPVHIEPSDGETPMAALPAAERARQEAFQQKVAVLLDELLHEQLGTVRPVDLAVNRYQGGSDGNTFPVVVSVRPRGGPGAVPADPACRSIPSKGLECRMVVLPGGIRARAITAEGNWDGSRTITGVDLKLAYGTSTVRLSVDGDGSSMVSSPVTVDQLVSVASDSRFLELVKYADGHPMEDKEHSVRGG